jgi:spermidine/putrescine transport system substrate-binding protein
MTILSRFPNSSLSRRALLRLLGVLPSAALLSRCSSAFAAESHELQIYSWPDYFSVENLQRFKSLTNIQTNISTYDSNETMLTKLDSPGGSGFDIVIPSSSWLKEIAGRGLLQELDHSRLDLSALDRNLMGHNYDPDNRFSIPKDWGLLGVVYDPEATGFEIETWEDFFRAGEMPRVSGKVRLSVSGWETIGPDLWLRGKNWNTVGEADIRVSGERLKTFAKHVKSFSGLDPDALASGAIVLAQTHQAMARAAIILNPKLRWVVPGPLSELWVDNYAIVKNAPDLDQAYMFLANQLQPGVQIAETEYIGFPAALAGLRDSIGPNVKNADLIFGGRNLDFGKLTTFVVNPVTIGAYVQTQIEIQAAAG